MVLRFAPILGFSLLVWAGASQAQCRQALVLGLDVSGSVDSQEYVLQMRGLADALRNPDVSTALLATPGAPVSLAVFEWSGTTYQRIVLDWTVITDIATLAEVSHRLEATRRRSTPPETALGQAMLFGARLLAQGPVCWKQTLDISGDGRSNAGIAPDDARARLLPLGFTLNALVIGAESPRSGIRQGEIGELISYFQALVIMGSDAFVEAALGFDDYEAAMVRKLKRELEGLALSALDPADQ